MGDKNDFSSLSESDKDRPHLSHEVTEALRDLLQRRLEECGWRENIRKMIRNMLDKRGVTHVSYEDIAIEVIPKARAMVPDDVRRELQMRVRAYMNPTFDDSK